MKPVFKLLLLLSLLTQLGCIDEIALELPPHEPLLVADVLISNEASGSHITIGWTYPVGSGCFYEDEFLGKIPVICEPDNSAGPYQVTGQLLITEQETQQRYSYPIQMTSRGSFIHFQPEELVGKPGHTYKLEIAITYENATSYHQATTKMLATPPIEKVSYEIRKGNVGKSDNFVPLIYYHEPQQEKNYYLFQICETHEDSQQVGCFGNSRVWNHSIISDEFLPEYVRGLSIDDGATVAKYAEFYPHVYPGVGAKVNMYNVHRETYEFYKVLLDQFNNDGGAFSPTPASPRGNISGAFGLFRALHTSTGSVFY